MDQYGIADRRKLRRKLTFWRAAAFVVVLASVIVVAAVAGMFDSNPTRGGDHIARVEISGVITDNKELLERLKKIGESDRAKALIVAVNSPGGTTYGGEAIYKAVRDIAKDRPVVTEVRTLAASAGYMIASASDHIVAGEASIVGSIGVIFQYAQVSGLLEKLGVSVDEIKSAPLKAEPSPFHPPPEGAKEMIRAMVLDSYDWFVDLVAERRGMERTQTLALADGSIFTGRQALENGLIDAIGGDDEVRAWLTEKGIDETLEVVDWKPKNTGGDLLFARMASRIAAAFGAEPAVLSEALGLLGDRKLFLDGLVSVWHFGSEQTITD